jgi:5-(carboxyamino)imidazole ribonucleotide mutase
MNEPLVGVVMGSDSDWEVMQHAARQLESFAVPHECRVVSAHRTPDQMFRYAETAAQRGLRCIIAGAGGAAHLPGMLAAKTMVPVLGVPVTSRHLQGLDSLRPSQMPKGVPVATFAIGEAGAVNAGLFAVARCSHPLIRPGAEARRLPPFPGGSGRSHARCRPRDERMADDRARRLASVLFGGGQLGRMFTMAAQSMGYHVVVLDPAATVLRGGR